MVGQNFSKTHTVEQHVDKATHIKGNTLDYVFAPEYVNIPVIEVIRFAFDSNFDHYPVMFEIDCAFKRDNTPTFHRKESADSWKRFKEVLDGIDIMGSMLDFVEGLSLRNVKYDRRHPDICVRNSNPSGKIQTSPNRWIPHQNHLKAPCPRKATLQIPRQNGRGRE